jgi:tetratricopeptide (TPR) repeat protein
VAETRVDELRRRLEQEPSSRLFAQLAEELRKAGDVAEAVRVARAGLVLHPNYPSARLTLGCALLEVGDRKGARTELAEAVRQAPDNILARRSLGQVLAESEDLPGALEHYVAALRMAPADAGLRVRIRDLALRLAPLEDAGAAPGGGSPGGPGSGSSPLDLGAPAGRAADSEPPAMGDEAAGLGRTLVREATVARGGWPEAGTARLEPSEPGRGSTMANASDAGLTVAVDDRGASGAQAVVAAGTGTGGTPAAADGDAGRGGTPLSSSTLAELYLRQGLAAQAVEVYRQVVAADPANGRARARLHEIEAAAGAAGAREDPSGAEDPNEARRRALERTIDALEALLSALRRR